jgi:transposase-like protein
MAEREIKVDASTIQEPVQTYAPKLDHRLRRNLKPTHGNWHVDETYIRIKAVWHTGSMPLWEPTELAQHALHNTQQFTLV